MNTFEDQYLILLSNLLSSPARQSRAGLTRSDFGFFLKFPMVPFPLLTTKRVFFRGVAEELFWMLRGDTSVKTLQNKNVHIWDEWTLEDGTIGYGYGHQMRGFNANSNKVISETGLFPIHNTEHFSFDDGEDQIGNIQNLLQNDPYSRRILVINYNPAQARYTSLPACHVLAQWYHRESAEGTFLDCGFYMRSSDVFLGLPFNIASYSLFTYLLCSKFNLTPGNLCVTLGDAHLYEKLVEPAKIQVTREPRSLPSLKITTPRNNIWEHEFSDLELIDYTPHPTIKGEKSI
jgi:thymidylate synthase